MSKVIVLANPPVGDIQPDTFSVTTEALPPLVDGQILVKIYALGNLPALRHWIDASADAKRFYVPPVFEGDVVRAPGLATVVDSKSAKYAVGDKISAFVDWREMKVLHEDEVMSPALDIPGQSPYISLSLGGINGATAWACVFREMKLEPGHTVLVSSAAGSVGSLVVQLAKHVVGCKRVVGIAGGTAKCDWVKSLGADECVDYKSSNFAVDLARALPDEADRFCDNVGGETLDAALPLMKRYSSIAVCGAISEYNGDAKPLKNWKEVIHNRIGLKGLIVLDHAAEFGRAAQELGQWLQEGKIKMDKETVVETKFEDIPGTYQRLFSGETQGTLITKLV